MSVTRNASLSASQIFGAIGAAATAVTTTCNTIGNAADVLSVKSKDWLHDTRLLSAATRVERTDSIVHDVSLRIAKRKAEVKKILDRDNDLRAAYLAAQEAVLEAIGQKEEQPE